MGKFMSFAKALATNRIGIVCAALNVCYFVANGFVGGQLAQSNFDKIMLSQNSPAIILTFMPLAFIELLFPQIYLFLSEPPAFVILLFFVTLQWLFVGWSAKMIARKIKRRAGSSA